MRDDSSNRLIMLVLFIFTGLVTGVLLATGLTEHGTFFLVSAVILAIIVLVIIGFGFYRTRERRVLDGDSSAGKGSQVGFVVDTFHDLVAKLKEKEAELERLRSFAEEKAARIEAYNENILQSVPSGVVSIDNEMNIKSVNQSAEKILGVTARDITGKSVSDVLGEPLLSIIRDDRSISRGEYRYITSDNRHIWLGITNSVLKNSKGEKIGMIYVFSDLSDIKSLEQQVELKHRLSQLGEMSAGIAHELRNSMSVISGYVKLLGRKANGVSRPAVSSIEKEISSMNNIISELLAFTRPADMNIDRVDIHSVIREILDSRDLNNNISSGVDPDEPLYVKGDEVLLRQAISNLVINAIEAMPDGGDLHVLHKVDGSKAVIYVSDTGIGIPEDKIDKIFLPFYTTKEHGTGFGLALVQKIIVSHGGTIDVRSREGGGTEFRITLPLAG